MKPSPLADTEISWAWYWAGRKKGGPADPMGLRGKALEKFTYYVSIIKGLAQMTKPNDIFWSAPFPISTFDKYISEEAMNERLLFFSAYTNGGFSMVRKLAGMMSASSRN